ncbi:zinc-binding protein A33-like [Callorhinchus milii]|uniref:zinc-binding protein A33-like n=1 Tax=Callorhinchus milii TaxID=7868 RepID=UPI0004574B3C|nr:zinc-binding protein A33-like [Callorhinchus milii]|eukprot:gi/632977851/ref/XP_007905577.1/ PREDICTED: zinc-binding protein A33-like [Callorhinchus milii]
MSVEDDIRSQFSCSICLDMFKDPVTTECEHDFCRPCITEYWDREETSICPLCRQYSSGTLRTNRTLACVVEILHSKKQPCGEEYETSSDSNFGFLLLVVLIFVIVLLWSLSPDASSLGSYSKDYDVCPHHKEKLKLFCEDDQELICLICRDSNKHKNHRVLPVNEAARYYKNELAATLDSLKAKNENHQILKSNYEENLTHLMDEVSATEQHIGKSFVHLHEFLRAEEERIMQELQTDAWQRFTVLQEVILQLAFESTSLAETIQTVAEDILQEDPILFLMKLKSTQERVKMSISDPKDVSVKVNNAKYKFLLMYNCWKRLLFEMGVNYESVILDPETAHHSLILFDNQSSVVSGTGPNGAPTGPSRFLVHPFVLAKCGFSSGIHYWEVSVGNKPDWVLGIAKKSVNRKTAIQLTPQNGLWALEKTSMYYLAHSQPRVLIFTGVKPKKIGIYLDYESGQVCFYNADNMSFMYMFKDTFTETVYPLFSPGLGFRPLRILHVNP